MGTVNVDRDILRFFSGHRTAVLTTVARWGMDIGTGDLAIGLAGLMFVGLVVATRWWRAGITIGVSVLVAQASARVLKQIIARPRPPEDLAVVQVGAFSMPSTVAAMTAALAVAVYSVVPWRVGRRRYAIGLLATGVALIGCAMVYLGAHWPTDVLAGWTVGVVVGIIVVRLSRTVGRRNPTQAPAATRAASAS
ncbi:phosphatase PAP2 family protein [Nocardia panacis]|uniref:Phosphatase PAP2 family protein n=1 Tax=Nocardia panacis TaxID=2340916 RepID=A0A3A4KKN1_9NOCA|nr:phosphatase PAP2 family protein [Nocardia panacis]RJO69819.1 phosphatase PAP2 family protein [Nocardia panacis]